MTLILITRTVLKGRERQLKGRVPRSPSETPQISGSDSSSVLDAAPRRVVTRFWSVRDWLPNATTLTLVRGKHPTKTVRSMAPVLIGAVPERLPSAGGPCAY